MCVSYRGAFRNSTQSGIKNEAFSEKSQQAFTIFRKKLNLRCSTMYCETSMYNPGDLPGYLYCFIASYISYTYIRRRPRTFFKCLKEVRLGRLFQISGPKTLKLLSQYLT